MGKHIATQRELKKLRRCVEDSSLDFSGHRPSWPQNQWKTFQNIMVKLQRKKLVESGTANKEERICRSIGLRVSS